MQGQKGLQDQQKAMAKLVAKAWTDEGFKARLKADPAAVLKAEGIEVPSGVSLNVVENTDKRMTFVLPAKPTDLSDADLDTVAGGGGTCASFAFSTVNCYYV